MWWHEKAALAGHKGAKRSAAGMLSCGCNEVKANPKKAIELISGYIEEDDDGEISLILGNCYKLLGDKENALACYQQAVAKSNNTLAMFSLADMLWDWNPEQAFELYKRAASLGNFLAMGSLSDLYSQKGDWNKAFYWCRKAAEAGNVLSMGSLGFCYLAGIGTNRDEVEALYWYEKQLSGYDDFGMRATARCGEVMANIGMIYCPYGMTEDSGAAQSGASMDFYNDQIGIEGSEYSFVSIDGVDYTNAKTVCKDGKKAFGMFEESAALGNVFGLFNLAICYDYGIGTTPDIEKAFGLYESVVERAEAGKLEVCNYYEYLAMNRLAIILYGKGDVDSKKRALNYFAELSNGTYMWLGEENLETIIRNHIDDKSMAMSALQKFNENRVDVENEIMNHIVEPLFGKEMETKEKKRKVVKLFRTAKTWVDDYMVRLCLLPNFFFLEKGE